MAFFDRQHIHQQSSTVEGDKDVRPCGVEFQAIVREPASDSLLPVKQIQHMIITRGVNRLQPFCKVRFGKGMFGLGRLHQELGRHGLGG